MLFIWKNVPKPMKSSNALDQITGKVIDVSRTHIPLKALMIPLKRVKLRGVVQVNQCLNTTIVSRHSPQKSGRRSFRSLISSQVKKTYQ